MKHSIKKPDPATHDEHIIYVFAAAVFLLWAITPAEAQNAHAELGRTNPDFAADLRRDAQREPDFEQDIPLWSRQGFEGWATPMRDGSVWITPAHTGHGNTISPDGVFYGD